MPVFTIKFLEEASFVHDRGMMPFNSAEFTRYISELQVAKTAARLTLV